MRWYIVIDLLHRIRDKLAELAKLGDVAAVEGKSGARLDYHTTMWATTAERDDLVNARIFDKYTFQGDRVGLQACLSW